MLAEWVTWLTADCPPLARRLGYLRESIGIRARHQRCRTAWQPHLDCSKAALLQSLQSCRDFRIALVFGSGLLLDIPLAELSGRFREVWLVDFVHLPAARKAARRYPNVYCITHDVTECLETLASARDLADAIIPAPTRFLDVAEVDWVASVNLLSQLPLLPQEWMRQHFPEADEPGWAEWGARLMQQHLDYLCAFSAPACLLMDTRQTRSLKNGNILEQRDFSALARAGQPFAHWRWEIAPPGEITPDSTRFHEVAALMVAATH